VIRKLLLRVPILGGWVERRWMPDPVERDAHREAVRSRLESQAKVARPAPPGSPQLTTTDDVADAPESPSA
jgi:hypothetical protein